MLVDMSPGTSTSPINHLSRAIVLGYYGFSSIGHITNPKLLGEYVLVMKLEDRDAGKKKI